MFSDTYFVEYSQMNETIIIKIPAYVLEQLESSLNSSNLILLKTDDGYRITHIPQFLLKVTYESNSNRAS